MSFFLAGSVSHTIFCRGQILTNKAFFQPTLCFHSILTISFLIAIISI